MKGTQMTTDARSDPVVIVSNDTHVGPRLVEDLRPYCPSRSIDEFDRFAAMTAEQRKGAEDLLGGSGYLDHPNLRTPGHHDLPTHCGKLHIMPVNPLNCKGKY